MTKNRREDLVQTSIVLHRAIDIPMVAMEWLWPGWLARGKLHIIAGAPGTGKTTLAMSMAAIVTNGEVWPDGSSALRGNVLIWSGEDDDADTLVPRLVAAGADLERIYLTGKKRIGPQEQPFDPACDMPLLMKSVKEMGGVDLIIIDPIVSVVTGDSHKNAEVRRALQPIVEMARDLGAAVLGVTHFSKGSHGRDPTERTVGSVAFGAVARVVMVTAKCDSGERILARAKSNLGKDSGGFTYHLCQTALSSGLEVSKVVWGEVLDASARELLGKADSVKDLAVDEASRWLKQMLEAGPVLVKELKAEASSAGLSWRTVQRAKSLISVQALRKTTGNRGKGAWLWEQSKAL